MWRLGEVRWAAEAAAGFVVGGLGSLLGAPAWWVWLCYGLCYGINSEPVAS